MTLLTITPILNAKNDGWIYLGFGDDGNFYIRSTAGRWSRVSSPQDFISVKADFDKWTSQNALATESDVKLDNQDTSVTPVTPVVQGGQIKKS